MKLKLSQQIFKKYSNIKPSRFWMWTDRQNKANSCILQFWEST